MKKILITRFFLLYYIIKLIEAVPIPYFSTRIVNETVVCLHDLQPQYFYKFYTDIYMVKVIHSKNNFSCFYFAALSDKPFFVRCRSPPFSFLVFQKRNGDFYNEERF